MLSNQPIVPGCGFHHLSISTSVLDESIHFYRDLFGMQILTEVNLGTRRLVHLDMGNGCILELSEPPADAPDAAKNSRAPGAITHLGVSTSDVFAAAQLVRSAGYPITVEPREVHAGIINALIAFVQGPSGESIEFYKVIE